MMRVFDGTSVLCDCLEHHLAVELVLVGREPKSHAVVLHGEQDHAQVVSGFKSDVQQGLPALPDGPACYAQVVSQRTTSIRDAFAVLGNRLEHDVRVLFKHWIGEPEQHAVRSDGLYGDLLVGLEDAPGKLKGARIFLHGAQHNLLVVAQRQAKVVEQVVLAD